ncbi:MULTISPECIES: ABC transporter permease [unclassified Mesotoga]|jgi:ribose transport system permease protein|uniref:ABC transporter permease n=1 Tax=unclassified Mesotoga TaxID=1184398 RepID=UPI000C191185|nr:MULTISPECIES: ABC transporter permease [unclassified Mesotoga]MDK2943651.1 ribose transport system permease protein [Mesotoga sp.]PIJ62500.1 sugar ABC transporter permease [Mesotoga sp. H07.pep.5.3]RLL86906.1 sugar ABC transporter permease [Mesotoga sp. H07pep.5.4]
MSNSDVSFEGRKTLTRKRTSILKSQWFYLLVAEIVIAVITGLVNPRFFSTSNIMNVLEQIAVLGVVSSGMTLLIISGEIDISVGANIGLSSVVMAMIIKAGQPYLIAIIAGIALAVFNSLLVGITARAFKAPSFITSLAFISVFQGVALAITKGTFQTIYGKFEFIGTYRLWEIVPLSFLISIAAYIVMHFLLSYTKLGRRTYAVGSNPSAAYLSGISVNKAKLSAFALNGLFIGVAAMVLLSRIGAAQPSTGSGIELKAIGAVVIGGTPLAGGKGRIIGTFFGVLLMGIISNSLNMLRVNPYFQTVTFGLLIIASLAVSVLSSYRKKEKIKPHSPKEENR